MPVTKEQNRDRVQIHRRSKRLGLVAIRSRGLYTIVDPSIPEMLVFGANEELALVTMDGWERNRGADAA